MTRLLAFLRPCPLRVVTPCERVEAAQSTQPRKVLYCACDACVPAGVEQTTLGILTPRMCSLCSQEKPPGELGFYDARVLEAAGILLPFVAYVPDASNSRRWR